MVIPLPEDDMCEGNYAYPADTLYIFFLKKGLNIFSFLTNCLYYSKKRHL